MRYNVVWVRMTTVNVIALIMRYVCQLLVNWMTTPDVNFYDDVCCV